jgi:hypothetical protein
MPNLDGTGPRGQGPMTGGGRGYCAVPLTGLRQTFVGQGRGLGWYGRGRGWRHWYRATGLPGWARAGYAYPGYASPYAPEQEVDMLKHEAEALKAELEEIQNRIEFLEKSQKPTSSDK